MLIALIRDMHKVDMNSSIEVLQHVEYQMYPSTYSVAILSIDLE